MAEITNELLYEGPESIQGRVTALQESQQESRSELNALRRHLIAMQTDIATLYSGQVRIEARLQRIERRLDLVDTEA